MKKALVWAHRGASAYAPENTLPAFEKAVEMGADGIIEAVTYGKEVVGVNAMHPALYNIQYPGFLEEFRENDLKIHVWTVNEEQYMRMLCEMQVDAMITDDPALGRKIADEYVNGALQPDLVQRLANGQNIK